MEDSIIPLLMMENTKVVKESLMEKEILMDMNLLKKTLKIMENSVEQTEINRMDMEEDIIWVSQVGFKKESTKFSIKKNHMLLIKLKA